MKRDLHMLMFASVICNIQKKTNLKEHYFICVCAHARTPIIVALMSSILYLCFCVLPKKKKGGGAAVID